MKFSLLVVILMHAVYVGVTGAKRRIDGYQNRNKKEIRTGINLREVNITLTNNSGWLALHLDQQLSREFPGQNIIISPSCLQMALALVLLASRGETSLQVAQILGSYDGKVRGTDIIKNNDTVHEILRRIFEGNDRQRGVTSSLRILHGSGIFIQEGYKLQSQYLNYSQNLYKSDVINTDFHGDPDTTRNKINSWVNNKTMGKIRELLRQPAEQSTKIMICSTLYFKGKWKYYFDELKRRETFTDETGKTFNVTMLSADNEYPHFVGEDGVEMIGLPYRGHEVRMYVILPKSNDIDGLRTLRESLTPKIVNEMIGKMKSEYINVKIPKMNLTTSVKLNKAFENLGVKNLFDPNRADLSGLLDTDSDSPGLYVSYIMHAVEIAIDKHGTEAGAATAIGIGTRFGGYNTFHVDRPFIFFIRNEITNSILFWGSIFTPE